LSEKLWPPMPGVFWGQADQRPGEMHTRQCLLVLVADEIFVFVIVMPFKKLLNKLLLP
jgi:hypothetical protein